MGFPIIQAIVKKEFLSLCSFLAGVGEIYISYIYKSSGKEE
jgi:hypothetical protein